MGLFNQILNAIDDPNQVASSGQLTNILNTVQQLNSSSNANSGQIQSLMSIVGSAVRSSLKEKEATSGRMQAQSLVNQFGGTSPSNQAVQALFSLPQLQQIIQVAAQRTGLDPNTIQAMLPILVPLVLNLLKSGTPAQNPQGGTNSVLNTFLDADGDGDVDVADALRMAAGRFLR